MATTPSPEKRCKVITFFWNVQIIAYYFPTKSTIFQQCGSIKPNASQATLFLEEERNAAFLQLVYVVCTRREVFSPSLRLKFKTGLRVGAISRQIRRQPERHSLVAKEFLLSSEHNVSAELTLAAKQFAILTHSHLRLERYDTWLACPVARSDYSSACFSTACDERRSRSSDLEDSSLASSLSKCW